MAPLKGRPGSAGGSRNGMMQVQAAQKKKNAKPAAVRVHPNGLPPSVSSLKPATTTYTSGQKRERPQEFDRSLQGDEIFNSSAQKRRPNAGYKHSYATQVPASATKTAMVQHTPFKVQSTRAYGDPTYQHQRRSMDAQIKSYSFGYHQHPTQAPAGLFNLGNTCYLNAVMQSLFSLPTFPDAVRAAFAAYGDSFRADGVMKALVNCLAERDASTVEGRSAFSPDQIKQAVGRRLGAFRGSFQQDAHEFFCGLIEATQGEVLAVESGRVHRRQIHASESADPATRVFGFAVEHEMTCSKCFKVSYVTEQATHLSLDLPRSEGQSCVPNGISAMLSTYFQEESIEKGCEGCGEECVAHIVRHRIKRLPQILALHVKRFQVAVNNRSQVVCNKVSDPVSINTTLRLRPVCVDKASPPLPALKPHHGKENEIVNLASSGAAVKAPPTKLDLPVGSQHAPSPPQQHHVGPSTFYSSQPAGILPSSLAQHGTTNVKTFHRRNNKQQGAACVDYWDSKKPSTFAATMQNIVSNSLDKKHVGDYEEDAALRAAIEASKREAERAEQKGVENEEEELATAIKRSLEEHQSHQWEDAFAFEDAQQSPQNVDTAAIDLAEAETPNPKHKSKGPDADVADDVVQPRFIPEIVEDDVMLNSSNTSDNEEEARKSNEIDDAAAAAENAPAVPELIAKNAVTVSSVRSTPVPLSQYRLTAIISHHGASAEFGHFAADTYNATSGEWYRFNDAHVERIAGNAATNELREKECYMLFYTASK